MLRRIVIFSAVLASASAGCSPRAVLVPESSPVRIGPEVSGRVYVLTPEGDWQLSGNSVSIPEGWYLVPPSFVEKE